MIPLDNGDFLNLWWAVVALGCLATLCLLVFPQWVEDEKARKEERRKHGLCPGCGWPPRECACGQYPPRF